MKEYITIKNLEIITEQSYKMELFESIMNFPYVFQIIDEKTHEVENYQPVKLSATSGIAQLMPHNKGKILRLKVPDNTYNADKFYKTIQKWQYRSSGENNITFYNVRTNKEDLGTLHLIIWHKLFEGWNKK